MKPVQNVNFHVMSTLGKSSAYDNCEDVFFKF